LRADPRPILHLGYDHTPADSMQRLAAQVTLHRGAFQYQVPGDPTGQFGLPANYNYWDLPVQPGPVEVAVQADLSDQPSGRYAYDATLGLLRFVDPAEQVFGVSTTGHGTVISVNFVKSPFGAGFGLAGWQQIVDNPDGSALWIDGDGTGLLFD